MDPNQLAIILGLLTNGLYSLILFTGNIVGKGLEDLAFREENIQERLTENKTIFALIIEGAFKELPPVIKQEEFCEFLGCDQTKDIVGRIYFFDGFASENPYSLETIRIDFTSLLSQYFNDREEISAIAPQLFSILIMCCQKSLETIITEEQDLSAIDAKLTLYFKHCIAVLNSYHDNLYREIKANQESLNELHIKFNEFDHKIKAGLNDLPQRIKLELQGCSFTSSFINMAPDLENNFIQRDTEYKQLIEGLLNYQNDKAVAITTALRGAGGYGKTTLAKAICHDERILKKFTDGILWVTLGENPKNLIGHIQDLIYLLSDKRPEFEGLEAATSYFKELLNKKNLLLVIDDVWDSSHLEPFLQGGTECIRLITTRVNEVLPENVLEVHVDRMKNEEAAKLLRSGFLGTDCWELDELARRLGYWPLLLKMVNSALKQHVERGKSFEEALDHVNHKLDKKNLTAFDPKNPKRRNQAVEATISVSFDLLDQDEFERYKELAIFPEDEEIPLKTVEKLWRKTEDYDYFDVEDLCFKLFNLSLLQTCDDDKKIIKLHDVMREYLNSKQQQKIHLIHSQFLEAYEVKTWADLPEEELYLWKYLSYHLLGAGRKDDLRKLLLDFNWIRSKLNSTNVHLLLNDYDFFPEDYPLEMVKGAIQLSANALSKDKNLLEGQLLGRLQLFSDTQIKSMLKDIRENRNGIRIIPLSGSLTPPGAPLLHTLEGHSAEINAVFVTSDGNYIVSTSDDKKIKVWDLKIGKELHTLTNQLCNVNSVAITRDGNYIVSASCDNTFKVWDLKTGKELHILMRFYEFNAVSVTPNGKYAISDSCNDPYASNSVLKIWDLKTGKEIHTLKGHSDSVKAISITPDGNYAVTVFSYNTFGVWNLKTGKRVQTLRGYSNSVNAVSVTPNGNYVVSASSDGTLKVWDLKTGENVHTLKGHSDSVNAVSVTPDGKYAVSASDDTTLKVWDLKTGKEVYTLEGHSDSVNAVSVTPDGKYAVSASDDTTLKVWDLKTGKEVYTLEGHFDWVTAVSITPDGKYLVSASDDKTIKVWNLKIGKEVQNQVGHFSRVNAITITPDGTYAVSASDDITLIVWDLKTGTEVHSLISFSHVMDVSVTPDCNYAVSASYYGFYGSFYDFMYDSKLKVWNLKTGKLIHALNGHSSSINAVSITPDGNYAISASSDKTLKVWDLRAGKEVYTFTGHSSSVRTVSVTPDGNYAISASSDNTLKLWDLKNRELVHNLMGHSSRVTSVSVTPDGNCAVSASDDTTLKVWDLRTGKEIYTLVGHSDRLNAVSISPDGNYAISASSDNMLKLWDLRTGKEVSVFSGDSPCLSATFSPDGTIVVAGEESGRVHFLLFEEKIKELKLGKDN